jgi:hypothetical protein
MLACIAGDEAPVSGGKFGLGHTSHLLHRQGHGGEVKPEKFAKEQKTGFISRQGFVQPPIGNAAAKPRNGAEAAGQEHGQNPPNPEIVPHRSQRETLSEVFCACQKRAWAALLL